MTLLALFLPLALTQAGSPSPQNEYTVRAGDTCASIIARFFPKDKGGDSGFHALNPQLGPKPHFLKAGQVVRLVDAPDATVSFLKPNVERRTVSIAIWFKAQMNDSLKRFDQISTREGAGAELTFRDSTVLRMKENALVVVLGADTKKSLLPSKRSGIQLLQGEARLTMSDFAKSPGPLEVRTPAGAISVEDSDGQVLVNEKKMTFFSQFKGQAQVKAQGKSVKVGSNQGTRVKEGEAPEPARDLLPPPKLSLPRLAALGPAGGSPTHVEFSQVPGAATYRVEVAADPGFVEMIRDERTTAADSTLTLPAGHYFARVSSIDSAGLQGMATQSEIDVVALNIQPKAQFGELVDLQLPPGLTLSDNGQSKVGPFRLLTAGTHTLALHAGTQVVASTQVDVAQPSFSTTAKGNLLTVQFDAPIDATLPVSIGGRSAVSTDRIRFQSEVAGSAASGDLPVTVGGQNIGPAKWVAPKAAAPPPPVEPCHVTPLRFDRATGNASFANWSTNPCAHFNAQMIVPTVAKVPVGFWLGASATPTTWLTLAGSLTAPSADNLGGTLGARFQGIIAGPLSIGASLDAAIATQSRSSGRLMGGFSLRPGTIDFVTAHGVTVSTTSLQPLYVGMAEVGLELSVLRLSVALNALSDLTAATRAPLEGVAGASVRLGVFSLSLDVAQNFQSSNGLTIGFRLGLANPLR
jgi:FecR protein